MNTKHNLQAGLSNKTSAYTQNLKYKRSFYRYAAHSGCFGFIEILLCLAAARLKNA